MEIRRATPADAPQLKTIAVAAKGHWGYAAEPMAEFAAEVMTEPAKLSTDLVYVATMDERIVGWCKIIPQTPTAMLDDLWVLPDYMGRGIGRALLQHAAAIAREQGATALELVADPNAQPFYERLGCVVIGETISEWNRAIPRMRLVL